VAAAFLLCSALGLLQIGVSPFFNPGPYPMVVLLGMGAVVLTALAYAGSARSFGELDRLRQEGERRVPGAGRSGLGWSVLWWLAWRQARGFALGMAIAGLAAGFLVLFNPLILWPVLTLLAGVLCGVTAFGDEQALGSYRFLGEQRLPPGRIWLVKTAVRLGLALATTLAALVPSLAGALLHLGGADARHAGSVLGWLFNDELLGMVVPTMPFLLVWVLHGFAVGEVCGILFRKTLVAGVIGYGAAALGACVWLPSLAGDGLSLWQYAAVPAAALGVSRLLLSDWTGGRLSPGGASLRLAGAAAVAGGWVAGALAWRVAEVPPLPDRLDVPALTASLPEHNEAGQVISYALEGLADTERLAGGARPTKALFPDLRQGAPELDFLSQAQEVLRRGWPRQGAPELAGWLRKVFDAPWRRQLAQASDLPLGVVENPRRLTRESRLRALEAARDAGVLLAVHGLWRQEEGEPAALAGDLRTGLTLSRNLRNHAVVASLRTAREVEERLLAGLDLWLARLEGRPDLLREMLALLLRHEAEMPDDTTDTLRAEYLVAENTLERPEEWLARLENDRLTTGERVARAAAVALAWRVPWEHARQERMLRWLYDGECGHLPGRHYLPPWTYPLLPQSGPRELESFRLLDLTRLRAAQLMAAVRLYQEERGKAPATLDALVPDYLAAVPLDPYDGRPFRYRISPGERIAWAGAAPPPGGMPEDAPPVVGGMAGGRRRWVPPGQGILWSVGNDRHDDKGLVQVNHGGTTDQGELIFLVPRPPRDQGDRP
jgi:hypothetical protein